MAPMSPVPAARSVSSRMRSFSPAVNVRRLGRSDNSGLAAAGAGTTVGLRPSSVPAPAAACASATLLGMTTSQFFYAPKSKLLGGLCLIIIGTEGFEVFQGVEDRVGEDPAQRLEPALRRVEFGAVGRQRDLLDAVGPVDFAAGVAAAVVEHEPDRVAAGVLAQLFQEALEADPVDVRQEQHDAGPAHRFDRGIQPEPVVLVVMGPRRPAAERAPQPAMRDLQTKAGFVHGECTASRDTVSSFFKGRLLGGADSLAVMRPAGLQLGLAPPEQLGNGIDAVPDVPGVAQIDLGLVQPADVAGPHLRLQTLPGLRRDPLLRATSLRWRQQRRQAAFAIALPPALNGSHMIAQHLRRLADARDTPLLKKPKHSYPIGSDLVPSRLLRRLQLRDIFRDQQRVSDVHD